MDRARRKPDRWLAIDDDALGWPTEELKHLVLTSGDTGLESLRVQAELRTRLAALLA